MSWKSKDVQRLWIIPIIFFILIFSFFTVYLQYKALGRYHIETGRQVVRHQKVLSGVAGNPWQYRILSDYLVEGVIQLFTHFKIPSPIFAAFMSFRFVQNILIFIAAYVFYRKLGFSKGHTLAGLAVLTWSMMNAYYDSDLQFNTYFDILFYLAAGIIILKNRPLLLIPLMLLGSLNRETCGLIPFLLIALYRPGQSKKMFGLYLSVFCVSMLIFGITYFTLRYIYGPQVLLAPYGHVPGIDLLKYNMFRSITWIQLFSTLNLVPLLALLSYKHWNYTLRVFFWVVVPIWVVIHFLSSQVAESRVFLVPQALIFIPGLLFLLSNKRGEESQRIEESAVAAV